MSAFQRRIAWPAIVFSLILSLVAFLPVGKTSQASAAPARVAWVPGKIPVPPAYVPPQDSPEFVDVDAKRDFTTPLAADPSGEVDDEAHEASFDAATSTEVVEERTADSETWRNGDGTFTTRYFTEPRYFEREGQWLAIDSSLVPDESRPEWLRTTANAWTASFGPIEPDGSGGVEVTGATGTVGFAAALDPDHAHRVLPEVDPEKRNQVRYREVWPGVDVLYTVGPDRVKEDIVVNRPPGRHEFGFSVVGAELQGTSDLVGVPTGELDFVGALDGEFRVAPPTVVDNDGTPVDDAAKPVQAATKDGGGAKGASRLAVSVDPAWIDSLTEQDFPVVIDPTLYSTGVSGWRNFWTDGGTGNLTEEPPMTVTHKVGEQSILGVSGRWRSMVKFNHEALFGTGVFVEDADLVLAGHGGYNSPQAVVAVAAPSGCLSYHCVDSGDPMGGAEVGSDTAPVRVDVTGFYRGWIFSEDDDRWIVFKTPELFSGDYKELAAHLEITYTHHPLFAVENPWPPNGAFIAGAAQAPEALSVDAVTDGDGDTVEYRFVVGTDAELDTVVADSGWFTPSPVGPRVSWVPPAGLLQIGTDYWWRVETRDQTHPALEPQPFRLRTSADRLGQDGFGGWFDGVNTLLGNYLSRDVDLHVESVGPSLDVVRTLNTVEGATTPRWGDHFMQIYDRKAIDSAASRYADVVYGDGRTERFTKVGADLDPEWDPPSGWNAKLEGPVGGPWTLTTGDGTVVSFAPVATGIGAPSSIAGAFGHQITFDRSVPDLVKVKDVASQREVRYQLVSGSQLVESVEVDNPAGGSPLAWTYQYDSGRLWKACDPLTHCKTYEWEVTSGGTARLKRIVDRNGHVDVELTYDGAGRVESVEDAYGNATTFDYEQNGELAFETEITDARGKVWVHQYSPDGNLTSEQLPGVAPTTYTYDAETRLRESVTDPNGNTSRLAYDDDYRVIAKENGESEKTFYRYDPAGNEIAVCDGRTEDSNGDDEPDANGYCVESNFATDLPTEEADEMRELRLIRSRATPTSGGNRATEAWTYTDGDEVGYGSVGLMPEGLVETHTDALGKVTHYEYFASGDLARVRQEGPGGFTGIDLRYTYDGLGRMLTQTEVSDTYPSGVTTTYAYDAVGNRISETGHQVTNTVSAVPHRARTTWSFDANRNVTQTTIDDLVGGDYPRITTMTYDDNDREIRVVDPEGNATERRLDAVGLVRLVRDGEGRWLRTTYNDRRLAVKIEMLGDVADPDNPAGTITTLSETQYDSAGRKTVETDGDGRDIVTEYDAADRPTLVTMPEYYDDQGGSTRAVVLKRVEYDAAGQAVILEEGDETGPFPVMRSLTNTYDEGGRLTRVEGGTAGYTRRVDTTYDDAGNPLSVVTTQLTPTPTTGGVTSSESRMAYDAGGRLVTETVENGSADLVTTHTYDRRGLRTSTVPPAGNAAGAVADDHRVTYQHDELGRLFATIAPEVSTEPNGGPPSATEPTSTVGFDTFGNQTHHRDPRGNVTVTGYDRLSRQTRIDHPSYTPPGGSAISAFEQFGYDGVGNQTSYRDRRACTTRYEFDELNRVRFQRDPAAGTACGGGQVIVSESFGGSNGEDWDANRWNTTTNAAGATVDLQSGEGRMVYAGESGSMRAEALNSTHTDATLTARFKFDTLEGVWAMFFLRASTTPSAGLPWAPTQGYTFAFTPAFGGTRYLKKVSGGAESVLEAEEPSPIAVDTWYRIRFEVAGSTVRGKVWPDGQPEPAAWSMQATDWAPLGAGGASIWVNTWEDIDPKIHFDDVRVTAGTVTAGASTEMQYDAVGNQTKIIGPTGAVTDYTYDARNRIRKQIDNVRAVTVTPQVGSPGPQSAETISATTHTTTFNHDDLGRQVEVSSPAGVTTRSAYDDAGTLVASTNVGSIGSSADDQVTQYVRDVMGNPVVERDPLGREQRYVYDQAGRQLSQGAYASSGDSTPEWESRQEYDSAGNVVRSYPGEAVHANSTTPTYSHEYSYDVLNRLISVTEPISSGKSTTTTFGYDAAGNHTRTLAYPSGELPSTLTESFTGTNGSAWPTSAWTSTVTTSGGVVDLQAGEGRMKYAGSSGSMHAYAQNEQHTDATLTARFKFDSIEGVWAMFFLRASNTPSGALPWAPTEGYTFAFTPAFGGTRYLKKITGGAESVLEAEEPSPIAANTWYRIRFEVSGSTVRGRVWPDGQTEPTTWSMEATDAAPLAAGGAAVWVNTWENVDHDVRFDDVVVSGGGIPAKTTKTYNSWNLEESTVEPWTAAHPTAANRTFTQVYDAGGLRTEDRQPGSVTVTATYDSLGRMTNESSGGASRTFAYDAAGRRTSMNHPWGTQAFVYDDRSLLVGATGPGGNTIARFDGDARLTSRKDPAGTHSYTWTSLNTIDTATDPLSGVVLDYTFNAAQQPTRVDYGTPGSSPYRTYTYDDAGRLASDTFKKADNSTQMSGTYAYDWDGNITQELLSLPGNSAAGTYDYTYDRASRLTEFERASGSTTEITQYAWDDAGNRLSAKIVGGASKSWTYDERSRIVKGPDGTYTWDARGTLDKIRVGASTVHDAAFDNLGRMTQSVTSAGTANYAYDGLDRMAVRNGSDRFGYAGTAIDPSSGSNVLYSRTPAGRLLAVKQGSNAARLAGLNRHGDLRWLHDNSGVTSDTNVMNPFGETIARTGTTGSNVGFQGDWTDPTSGDVWMGARWYTPKNGTFRSRDTYSGELRTPVTLNRYTYAGANPIRYFDPDGRCFGPLTICTPGMADLFNTWQETGQDLGETTKRHTRWQEDNPDKVAESQRMAFEHNLGTRIDSAVANLGIDASGCGDDYRCRKKLVDDAVIQAAAESGAAYTAIAIEDITHLISDRRQKPLDEGLINFHTERCRAGQVAAGSTLENHYAMLNWCSSQARSGVEFPAVTEDEMESYHQWDKAVDEWYSTFDERAASKSFMVGVFYLVATSSAYGASAEFFSVPGSAATVSGPSATPSVASAGAATSGPTPQPSAVAEVPVVIRPANSTGDGIFTPGRHADASVAARGPQQSFTAAERSAIDEIGATTGCHRCGATAPGRSSGHFTPDHQPVSSMNPAGAPQLLYPHCATCSSVQGGYVSAWLRTWRRIF